MRPGYDRSRNNEDKRLTPDAPIPARTRSVKQRHALLFGLGLLAFMPFSLAQEQRIQFDIPAQPLEAALEAFAEQSRMQVLYETAVTAGRRSSETRGVLTQDRALRRLLSGTGLEFSYTADRAFTLVPVRAAAASALVQGETALNPFLGLVQTGVLAVLCRNPETRPGAFRLAMQFWIGNSGRIENPRLLKSTGASRRDAAIAEALVRVVLERSPPSGMPQPITMVLNPGPADARDECMDARP